MFNSGDLCLKTGQGESIRFHSSILALSSPLLSDLISEFHSETRLDHLDVEGDQSAWEIIRNQLYLPFLPAQNEPLTIEEHLEIFPLLHKYQFDTLLSKSISFLSSLGNSLTLNSMFKVLIISKELQIDGLFARILQQISNMEPSIELISHLHECGFESEELAELKLSALSRIEKKVCDGSFILDESTWSKLEKEKEGSSLLARLDLSLAIVKGAASRIKQLQHSDVKVQQLWHCLSCSSITCVFSQMHEEKSHQPDWLKVVEGCGSSSIHNRCSRCGSSTVKKDDPDSIKIHLKV